MRRTGGAGGADDPLVGELVTSPQRREVVWYLTDSGGTATFDEVVDALADGAERTMTAVRLHHVHLPKLRAVGAVEWDEATGDLRVTPRAAAVVGDAADDLFGGAARNVTGD